MPWPKHPSQHDTVKELGNALPCHGLGLPGPAQPISWVVPCRAGPAQSTQSMGWARPNIYL